MFIMRGEEETVNRAWWARTTAAVEQVPAWYEFAKEKERGGKSILLLDISAVHTNIFC